MKHLTLLTVVLVGIVIIGALETSNQITHLADANVLATDDHVTALQNEYLLYVYDGRLYAKSAFDQALPVTLNNSLFVNFNSWAWSEKAKTLAMVSNDGALYLLTEGDTTSRLLFEKDLTATKGYWNAAFAWSPDGTRLLWSFPQPGQPDHQKYWIGYLNLLEKPYVPRYILSTGPHPDWAPDNQNVVLEGDVSRSGDELQIIPATCFQNYAPENCSPTIISTANRRYLETERGWRNPRWSPDSKRIVFSCNTVCTISSTSTNYTELPVDGADDVFWSPDGKYLSYDSDFSINIYNI